MKKPGYNDIDETYFTFRNIQGKYNKRNSWIEVCDETMSKPKIRK